MRNLTVLQAIRLKGRVGTQTLADALGMASNDVAAVLAGLATDGLVTGADSTRLTAAGETRCTELLATERTGVDREALTAAYRRFCPVNAELKALVTDWQLRHDDTTLSRLDDVHRRVLPIIDAVAGQLPRLARYRHRLTAALDRIHGGDPGWLTRPLADSYHTVWFELHEELLQACGLTRRSDD